MKKFVATIVKSDNQYTWELVPAILKFLTWFAIGQSWSAAYHQQD